MRIVRAERKSWPGARKAHCSRSLQRHSTIALPRRSNSTWGSAPSCLSVRPISRPLPKRPPLRRTAAKIRKCPFTTRLQTAIAVPSGAIATSGWIPPVPPRSRCVRPNAPLAVRIRALMKVTCRNRGAGETSRVISHANDCCPRAFTATAKRLASFDDATVAGAENVSACDGAAVAATTTRATTNVLGNMGIWLRLVPAHWSHIR